MFSHTPAWTNKHVHTHTGHLTLCADVMILSWNYFFRNSQNYTVKEQNTSAVREPDTQLSHQEKREFGQKRVTELTLSYFGHERTQHVTSDSSSWNRWASQSTAKWGTVCKAQLPNVKTIKALFETAKMLRFIQPCKKGLIIIIMNT